MKTPLMVPLLSTLLTALLLLAIPSCGDKESDEQPPIEISGSSAVMDALANGDTKAMAEEGAKYFVYKKCNFCHKTKGTVKSIGPILAGINQRMKNPFLETWIRHPRRMKSDSQMPVWDGTDEELAALIAYLGTL